MGKLKITGEIQEVTITGTSLELDASGVRPDTPTPPPVVPPPAPTPGLPIPHPLKPPLPVPESERVDFDKYPKNPNGYVPIVITEVQIPKTTWDDVQIDPARPYGTKPDFEKFKPDTR